MNDIQGTEVKVGDRVAFRETKGIKTGRVIRVRTARRYRNEYEVAKVRLDEPIRRFERGCYLREENGFDYRRDADGNLIYVEGAERTPITEREVWGGESLIVIPEKSVKEDLTTE